MTELLERRYTACENVFVVCDNPDTHTIGVFYGTFEPERTRDLVRQFEFHYTPKRGNWHNMAENELSCLTRPCVGVAGRRIGIIEQLQE